MNNCRLIQLQFFMVSIQYTWAKQSYLKISKPTFGQRSLQIGQLVCIQSRRKQHKSVASSASTRNFSFEAKLSCSFDNQIQ